MGRNYLSFPTLQWLQRLPHLGWVRDICVSKLTNIGSDNGLSPGRRQAIIWTNAGILLVVSPGTNFNEILLEISIQENPFQTVVWKMAAILSRSQCVKVKTYLKFPVLTNLSRWSPSYVIWGGGSDLKFFNLYSISGCESVHFVTRICLMYPSTVSAIVIHGNLQWLYQKWSHFIIIHVR